MKRVSEFDMTTENFIAIAASLRARIEHHTDDDHCAVSETARAAVCEITQCALMFCAIAQAENPKFDRQRFLQACGLELAIIP